MWFGYTPQVTRVNGDTGAGAQTAKSKERSGKPALLNIQTEMKQEATSASSF
jgi:hypothetical protein